MAVQVAVYPCCSGRINQIHHVRIHGFELLEKITLLLQAILLMIILGQEKGSERNDLSVDFTLQGSCNLIPAL